jgi:alkylation response protein AidB-like acyl-CoA dehydrogenase
MAVETSVPLSVFSTGLGLMPLLFFGTGEQQSRLLTPFLSGDGEPLAANFRQSGPDVGIQTVARRDGDEWVITGRKKWTPHASGWDGKGADLLTVACRTDLDAPPRESLAVLAVPGRAHGITIDKALPIIGHRAALVYEISFHEVRVPAGNLLGAPGDGIRILDTVFSATATLVGAFAVGVMRAAFEAALAFATAERRGGLTPIIEHQNVGTILVDMKARLEAARYLTWKACDYFDRTGGAGTEIAVLTKIFSSEAAVQVVYDAMRLVGIESYTDTQPFADLLRDALAYPLFDGGNVGVRRPYLQALLWRQNQGRRRAGRGVVAGRSAPCASAARRVR